MLCLAATSLGCGARQGIETQHLPDGSIRLTCAAPLQSCLNHANRLCKDTNYTVLSARDQRDAYGPELGTSQVEIRSSEAVIRCTRPGQAPSEGASSTSAPPTPALPSQEPPRNAPICVPGSTQACVGPGACRGGQACLPNSSGYGPCDCGLPTYGPAAPGIAPRPSEPAPAFPASVPSAGPGKSR